MFALRVFSVDAECINVHHFLHLSHLQPKNESDQKMRVGFTMMGWKYVGEFYQNIRGYKRKRAETTSPSDTT